MSGMLLKMMMMAVLTLLPGTLQPVQCQNDGSCVLFPDKVLENIERDSVAKFSFRVQDSVCFQNDESVLSSLSVSKEADGIDKTVCQLIIEKHSRCDVQIRERSGCTCDPTGETYTITIPFHEEDEVVVFKVVGKLSRKNGQEHERKVVGKIIVRSGASHGSVVIPAVTSTVLLLTALAVAVTGFLCFRRKRGRHGNRCTLRGRFRRNRCDVKKKAVTTNHRPVDICLASVRTNLNTAIAAATTTTTTITNQQRPSCKSPPSSVAVQGKELGGRQGREQEGRQGRELGRGEGSYTDVIDSIEPGTYDYTYNAKVTPQASCPVQPTDDGAYEDIDVEEGPTAQGPASSPQTPAPSGTEESRPPEASSSEPLYVPLHNIQARKQSRGQGGVTPSI